MKHEELMNEIKRAYTDYCLGKTKTIDFDSFCAGYGCGMDRAGKTEENYTIEQNAGENRIEGGVLGVSGSVDTFRCWKCGRTLPISERSDFFVYMSNPPKYSCKECEEIKKEKLYRPFNNCSELIEYWYDFTGVINCSPKLFMPQIWVKHKTYETDNLITAFDNYNKSIGGSCVFIQDQWFTLQDLYENFVFLDGSPVGKLEE